jgi:hypothetical protein
MGAMDPGSPEPATLGNDDISCHAFDLTTRNEFHNGKAQKKAQRWIDLDLSSGLT